MKQYTICVPNNWMAVLTFVSPYEPNQTYTQPFPSYVQCLRVFAHTYHKEGEGRPLKAVARSLATSGVNGEIEEGSGEKVPLSDQGVRPLLNDSSHWEG